LAQPSRSALGGRRAELRPAALCIAAALAAGSFGASATTTQGYSLTLAPLAHHGAQWLIVRADERSDPNTITATGKLPSLLRERRWWVLFDHDGRARCTVTQRPGDADSLDGARARLRQACRGAPALLRQGTAWADVPPPPPSQTRLAWTPARVCAGPDCVATASTQRTAFDRAPPPSAQHAVVSAAAARCVAARWLIVSNVEPPQGSGEREGMAFRPLPPSVPAEIVGYEFVSIDGVAIRPRALRC
jgi:hypothetical protein